MNDINHLITSSSFISLIIVIQIILFSFNKNSLITARMFMEQKMKDEFFAQQILNNNISIQKIKVVLYPKLFQYCSMLINLILAYMFYLLFVDSITNALIIILIVIIIPGLFLGLFLGIINKYFLNVFLKSQYKSLNKQQFYSMDTLGLSTHNELMNFIKVEMEPYN